MLSKRKGEEKKNRTQWGAWQKRKNDIPFIETSIKLCDSLCGENFDEGDIEHDTSGDSKTCSKEEVFGGG